MTNLPGPDFPSFRAKSGVGAGNEDGDKVWGVGRAEKKKVGPETQPQLGERTCLFVVAAARAWGRVGLREWLFMVG
jgi:hypothetical protein